MVATLNQPQYTPWPLEEQVVAIFAGIQGLLDDVPTDQVPRFQEELREYLRTEGSIYERIRKEQDFPEELQDEARKLVDDFKSKMFTIHEESGLAGAAA
jgi:F-type H+/Na+-transporting ATPase subunit alpha